jgi:hypothetical protein
MRQLLNSLADVGFTIILWRATDLSGELPKCSCTEDRSELYKVSCIKAIDYRIVNQNNPAVNRLVI